MWQKRSRWVVLVSICLGIQIIYVQAIYVPEQKQIQKHKVEIDQIREQLDFLDSQIQGYEETVTDLTRYRDKVAYFERRLPYYQSLARETMALITYLHIYPFEEMVLSPLDVNEVGEMSGQRVIKQRYTLQVVGNMKEIVSWMRTFRDSNQLVGIESVEITGEGEEISASQQRVQAELIVSLYYREDREVIEDPLSLEENNHKVEIEWEIEEEVDLFVSGV